MKLLKYLPALLLASVLNAQSTDICSDALWNLEDVSTRLSEENGRSVRHIEGQPGSHMMWLKDMTFLNGRIEVDIKAEHQYVGLAFRVQSSDIYECLYFRPGNLKHESANMRSKAVQYMAEPGRPWYWLRARYPGKYESGADVQPGQWFHVSLDVQDDSLRVYVNHQPRPVMRTALFNDPRSGSVGLWVGNKSAGTFSNLKVTPRGTAPAVQTQRPELAFLWDTFKNRRSVRAFKDTPVPEKDLMTILDMARTAPTAGNQQPWKFMVLRDRSKLNELRDKCLDRAIARARARGNASEEDIDKTRTNAATYYGNYLSAPVYVVVMTDSLSPYPSYNTHDGALAGGYLMLAARALGYGTVYSQDSIPWELIKEVFEIPGHYQRICFTPIGVPVEWPESHSKKPLEEFMVWEAFQPPFNYTPPVAYTAITLSPEALAAFTGTFAFDESTKAVISAEADHLIIALAGQPASAIYPYEAAAFFMKGANVQIQFKTENGSVTGLIFHQNGQTYEAVKE